MKLFFDTETTGLPDFKSDYDADHQPRLLQVAGILTDNEGHEVSSLNLYVRPNGFTIPERVINIHGITNEKAHKFGVDIYGAIRPLVDFIDKAEEIIGHNIAFDMFMIKSELIRCGLFERDLPDKNNTFCTMHQSRNICKIPFKNGYKLPKLQEVYKHAFGKEFANAHDALADIRATKEVYFWIKNLTQNEGD